MMDKKKHNPSRSKIPSRLKSSFVEALKWAGTTWLFFLFGAYGVIKTFFGTGKSSMWGLFTEDTPVTDNLFFWAVIISPAIALISFIVTWIKEYRQYSNREK